MKAGVGIEFNYHKYTTMKQHYLRIGLAIGLLIFSFGIAALYFFC